LRQALAPRSARPGRGAALALSNRRAPGDKTTTVYAPRITGTFFLGLLIFGARISAARVRVPDLRGEEFEETIGSTRAGGCDNGGDEGSVTAEAKHEGLARPWPKSKVSNAQKPVIRRRLANGSNRPLLAGPGTEGMR
jgi:hypothetical protein